MRENRQSAVIAPISAQNMSDCVSHGSPWVPGVPFRALPERERCSPFDQLVGRADRQDDGHDDEHQHLPAPDEPAAGFGFQARDERRHEALEEVTDLVVGVAAQVEKLRDLEAQRDPRVGVGPAEHQDERVDEDAGVEQGGEREAAAGRPQEGQGNDHREDLEEPRRAVVGTRAGQCQQGEYRELRPISSFRDFWRWVGVVAAMAGTRGSILVVPGGLGGPGGAKLPIPSAAPKTR